MNSHVRFCLKMIENILTYEFNTYRLVDIISYVFFSSGTNRHRKEESEVKYADSDFGETCCVDDLFDNTDNNSDEIISLSVSFRFSGY